MRFWKAAGHVSYHFTEDNHVSNYFTEGNHVANYFTEGNHVSNRLRKVTGYVSKQRNADSKAYPCLIWPINWF